MSSLLSNRWIQLTAGIMGMVAIANLQYGWTFFVLPLREEFGWDRAAIQWAFTLFVLTETWLVPIEAFVADRWGPRRMMLMGAVLCALGWVINSHAQALWHIYLGSILAGTGAGAVYGISLGAALKWFPDRRGLAAGLTAGAFGAGSALTVLPIRWMIEVHGFRAAFYWFGLGQGLVVLLAALVLRFPRSNEVPAVVQPRVRQSGRDCTPWQMVSSPMFWLLYGMMTMVTTGGLMAIAQIDPMSHDLGVKDAPLQVLPAFDLWVISVPALILSALTAATMIDRVLNGVTRPFFGWISDRIGREVTMFIAFSLEGVAIILLIRFGHIPSLFVLFTGLTFFAWGEIYSLFPALVGDLWGRRYAATNYGIMYTAKGMSALLVPLGSMLKDYTGSWMYVFAVAVAFDWITALLAICVVLPMRGRQATAPVALIPEQSTTPAS